MIEVKEVKGMGRGLFATKNIKAGTIVHVADFIKVKESELVGCPTIAKYVFTYTKKYSVLCLGLGSLFNHADEPNVEVCFQEHEGREVMEFCAKKDVKSGEQMFISYGGEEYAFYHLVKK